MTPRPPTANATTDTADKPGRLLAEGRVTLHEHRDEVTTATVRGDTDEHLVWRIYSNWCCEDCPSWRYRHRCSHVDAVRRIVCDLAPIDRDCRGAHDG